MDLFRVRLNCIDHYQGSPSQFDVQLQKNTNGLKNQHEPKVPIIRAFGATETGQKVCAHIHGAFPYMYIEYTGSLAPDDVRAYIHRLHLSIDHALSLSYRRNVYNGDTPKYVARITLVKGVPFYGFHVGYQYYLKIYTLDPMVTTRLADLLRQGVVMKTVFQPYEAHIQFIPQWMMDYNLYGCAYLDCKNVRFRGPVPEYQEQENPTRLWHDRSIPQSHIVAQDVLPRVSHCSIEVDICVQDILNRHDIKPRPLHHDFSERLAPLAPDAKLVHSMAGLWRDETRRRRAKMGFAPPGSSPFPPEVMVSVSADPRNSQPGGWIHEEEYRDILNELIDKEKPEKGDNEPSFDSFVEKSPFEPAIQTALESVEDLYPTTLGPRFGFETESITISENHETHDSGIEVDENRINSIRRDDDGLYDSDEEVMRELEATQRSKLNQDKPDDQGDIAQLQMQSIDNEVRPDEGDPPQDHEVAEDPASSPMSPENTSHLSAVESSSSEASKRPSTQLSSGIPDSIGSTSFIPSHGDVLSRKPNGDSDFVNGKRTRSLSPRDGSNKRQRIELEIPTVVNKRTTGAGRHRDVDLSASQNDCDLGSQDPETRKYRKIGRTASIGQSRPPSSSMPLRFSQESIKATGDNTDKGALKFQVVKHPYDSSIKSKPSQLSASQQHAKTASQKQTSSAGSLSASQPQATSYDYASSVASPQTNGATKLLQRVASKLSKGGPGINRPRCLLYSQPPPKPAEIVRSMQAYDLPPAVYQDAHYSNELDVPDQPREFAGKVFKLESLTVPFLPDFDASGVSPAISEKVDTSAERSLKQQASARARQLCTLRSWEIGTRPPSYSEVNAWLEEKQRAEEQPLKRKVDKPKFLHSPAGRRTVSQVEGPTQKNKHGFKYTQNQKTTGVQHETRYMSTMSLELHVNTRGTLVPNPEEDEIQCIFWSLQTDENLAESKGAADNTYIGIVALSEESPIGQKIARQAGVKIQEENSELDVLIRVAELVRNFDPDILTGYEVHGSSWGYLIERARRKYDYDLCDELSRMKSQSHGRFGKDKDKWGSETTSTIRITGRHMINIWRAMRSELNLLQYTMENVVFHLLHRRIPHYPWHDLTAWYRSDKPKDLQKVIDYYVSRVQLDLEILEQNELISRTSEQARLLGVDFFSVFSRGSQFKVESLMFRIAKPENFLLVSPSRKQVGGQNALECLPLVMEPQSAFYNSPLLVLDFQSLYPSVMIAYNYCYSTFLGRVVDWRGTNKMGFTEYNRQQRLLELLKDHINIAPNGIMYAKPEIRKSLLAKMLGEILETRVMVKSGMKVDKDDKTLQRLLNNRQLALKLIANVTYGYTSASFSGRMPCSEIADSIVQTGRETLEKAIALIHSVKRWGAEVVYGDTDSLFVYLKGRTKEQAFDIGEEIAKTVTNMNPRPVKLKFEKVYHPCVLLAKKRYVGFKYESRDQKEPEFDAKGIETVRRDGTPAEQKIEEKALKILFRTADLSQVKSYFQQQCDKIMRGSVSIQDFSFAREVKLGTYSDKGPPPPGALISTKRMLEDARAEPQYGERVPYVVIIGPPGARLIDRCVSPGELLNSEHNELDAEYYITKNLILPLERIFNLMGANVRKWYDDMPKIQRVRRTDANLQAAKPADELIVSKKTLESYMNSSSCLICKEKLETEGSICDDCFADGPASVLTLRTRLSERERKSRELEAVCRSCSGTPWGDEIKCDSQDCPVFYSRTRQKAKLRAEKSVVEYGIKVLNSAAIDSRELEW